MRTRSSALSRTFTALPTSWLWPAGPPIWQMSALGVVVALSAVAVPALPTVLPDKPPSAPAPAVAGPATDHDRSTDSPEASPTGDISASPSATSVPEVSAVVPSQQPGETPSQAPTATSSASPSETPTEAASPTQAPPTSSAPSETTAPAAPANPSTTIAATDPGNQRWLVTGIKCATCASGSRIVGIGLLATLTVPFSADGNGPRQLTIAYETKLQRNLYVSVNGATPQKLTLAGTGGWKQPGWTSMDVDLKTGSNTLTFSNPLGLAPDLDQFTIS